MNLIWPSYIHVHTHRITLTASTCKLTSCATHTHTCILFTKLGISSPGKLNLYTVPHFLSLSFFSFPSSPPPSSQPRFKLVNIQLSQLDDSTFVFWYNKKLKCAVTTNNIHLNKSFSLISPTRMLQSHQWMDTNLQFVQQQSESPLNMTLLAHLHSEILGGFCSDVLAPPHSFKTTSSGSGGGSHSREKKTSAGVWMLTWWAHSVSSRSVMGHSTTNLQEVNNYMFILTTAEKYHM